MQIITEREYRLLQKAKQLKKSLMEIKAINKKLTAMIKNLII